MTGLCWVLFGYALICLITNVYSQADPFDETDDKEQSLQAVEHSL